MAALFFFNQQKYSINQSKFTYLRPVSLPFPMVTLVEEAITKLGVCLNQGNGLVEEFRILKTFEMSHGQSHTQQHPRIYMFNRVPIFHARTIHWMCISEHDQSSNERMAEHIVTQPSLGNEIQGCCQELIWEEYLKE